MTKLKEITIKKMTYGPYDGQYVGTIEVEGEVAKTEVRMPPATAHRLLKLCAEEIAAAVSEGAQEFRDELLSSINKEQE